MAAQGVHVLPHDVAEEAKDHLQCVACDFEIPLPKVLDIIRRDRSIRASANPMKKLLDTINAQKLCCRQTVMVRPEVYHSLEEAVKSKARKTSGPHVEANHVHLLPELTFSGAGVVKPSGIRIIRR